MFFFIRSSNCNLFRMILSCLLVFGLLAGVSGCDNDDDERTVQVCNNDDEEYDVLLHRYSDGAVIMDFHLEEIYHPDHCDEFENMPEGRYYLTIYEDGGSEITDTSDHFYVDDDDYHTFAIDSTGSIDD